VEIISFERELETEEEKIKFTTDGKNEGNEYIKTFQWNEALESYEKRLKYVQFAHSENEEIKIQQNALLLSLFLNKSLATLNLEGFAECFDACNEVFKLDNKNGKTFYGGGLCLKHI
jgi:hypothetical protein